MTEWLVEDGIGEARAALIDDDTILEARILPDDGGVQAGAVVRARLVEILPGTAGGRLELEDGEEALIDRIPDGTSEGADLTVRIVRPAIPEPGRPKRALARPASDGADIRPAPSLSDSLAESGFPVRTVAAGRADRYQAAGWSALIEQAVTGAVSFAGGALRITPAPAMTLIDIDGSLDPRMLAIAGAEAAGCAIRRLDITGSIGLDLPTLRDKPDRQTAAEALDAALPVPFERTAVNGFGFLQLVRRRERLSIVEIVRYRPIEAAARDLLRRAEHTSGHGERTIAAAPAVAERLSEHDDWIAELERRIGRAVKIESDPALGLWAGHVSAAQPG